MIINPGDIYIYGSGNQTGHVQLIIAINKDVITLMTCVTHKNNQFLIFENLYRSLFEIRTMKLNE